MQSTMTTMFAGCFMLPHSGPGICVKSWVVTPNRPWGSSINRGRFDGPPYDVCGGYRDCVTCVTIRREHGRLAT